MPIRVTALALIQRPDGKILVEKGIDSIKQETFYRLIGGGVEFGETGKDAVTREFIEEIGKEILTHKLIQTVENIFTYEGDMGHEINLIYQCEFKNQNDNTIEHHPRIDGNDSHTYWKSLEDIKNEDAFLYPEIITTLI